MVREEPLTPLERTLQPFALVEKDKLPPGTLHFHPQFLIGMKKKKKKSPSFSAWRMPERGSPQGDLMGFPVIQNGQRQ
jgi:hypothetical protein